MSFGYNNIMTCPDFSACGKRNLEIAMSGKEVPKYETLYCRTDDYEACPTYNTRKKRLEEIRNSIE